MILKLIQGPVPCQALSDGTSNKHNSQYQESQAQQALTGKHGVHKQDIY